MGRIVKLSDETPGTQVIPNIGPSGPRLRHVLSFVWKPLGSQSWTLYCNGTALGNLVVTKHGEPAKIEARPWWDARPPEVVGKATHPDHRWTPDPEALPGREVVKYGGAPTEVVKTRVVGECQWYANYRMARAAQEEDLRDRA